MTAPSRGSQLALSVSYAHPPSECIQFLSLVLFFPYPSVKGQKVKRSDDSCLLNPFTPQFLQDIQCTCEFVNAAMYA